MPSIWGKFAEYGLVGLMAGAICVMLFFIIKWTLSTTKDILNQAAKEREIWNASFTEINKTLTSISDNVKHHDERADERGKYVREEHKQMIETLGRMNGYKTP